MSDEQEQPTIDDVWINRMAQKLGILTAQNERLMVENEVLRAQLEQSQGEPLLQSGAAAMNGEGVLA